MGGPEAARDSGKDSGIAGGGGGSASEWCARTSTDGVVDKDVETLEVSRKHGTESALRDRSRVGIVTMGMLQ